MNSAGFYSLVAVSLVVCVTVLLFLIYGAVSGWLAAFDIRRELKQVAMSVLQPLMSRAGPRSEQGMRELQVRLIQAGLRDAGAPRRFAHLRLLCMANAALLVGLLAVTGVDFGHLVVLGTAIMAVGLLAPSVWVSRRIRDRQAAISRALPSTIDLVAVCLDAGLNIEQGFQRVVAELSDVHVVMAEEAGLMVGEMAAGITFAQSLKRMAERVGLAELILLARLVAQGTSLGSSMTRTLREYSESAHNRRMLGLDERAGKISAATTLPVTLCLLPAALMMVVGPSLVIIIGSLQRGG